MASWNSPNISCNGCLHLQNLEWLVGDSRPWREPKLEVTLSAAGKTDNLKLRDLVQASVRVEAGKDVLAVEMGLLKATPERWLEHAHHWLILHGRYTCDARKPRCPECLIRDLCEFRDKTPPASPVAAPRSRRLRLGS